MKSNKIGILSGMGAAAGARFYSLLIEQCQMMGAKRDSDFPEVMIYNVSSKGLDNTGICNERLIKADILKALYQFDLCAVDTVIMACNSVHVFHEFFQGNTSARILNMVKSAQEASRYHKVGVISSRSTRAAKLYAGLQVDDAQQDQVDAIIDRAISGTYKESQLAEDKMTLYRIIDSLVSEGAQAVILGCTELPLVATRRMAVIDPAEIIVKEALSL